MSQSQKNLNNIDVTKIIRDSDLDQQSIIDIIDDLINIIKSTAKSTLGTKHRNNNSIKPWITKEIKKSINQYRNYLKFYSTFSQRKKKRFRHKMNDLSETRNFM